MGIRTSLQVLRYETDLYEWGRGWKSTEQAEKWDKHLRGYHNFGWTVIPPTSSGECFRIAGIYSCIYLHPMSGLLTLNDESELGEVKKIIQEAVEAAGGTVRFRSQKVNYTLTI